MDTSVPTPQHTELERDEQDHLPAENLSATSSTNSESTTRTVPKDPESRKMFIQEVSQAYIVTPKISLIC
jgi:hypothetical protein